MIIQSRFGLGFIITFSAAVLFFRLVNIFVQFQIVLTFSCITTVGIIAFEIPLCFMTRSVNGYATLARGLEITLVTFINPRGFVYSFHMMHETCPGFRGVRANRALKIPLNTMNFHMDG